MGIQLRVNVPKVNPLFFFKIQSAVDLFFCMFRRANVYEAIVIMSDLTDRKVRDNNPYTHIAGISWEVGGTRSEDLGMNKIARKCHFFV